MTASRFVIAIILTLGIFFVVPSAEPQSGAKLPRVGSLGTSLQQGPDAFAEGLRALGWIEGQNVIIERRYTEGNVERAPQLAAELVRLNVDVIVAAAPPNVRALKRATSSIPVVMFAVSDPVGMGFVESLARPGGNITGVTSSIPEGFMAKSLQLIKEALPNTARVGLLVNTANPLNYATASAEQLATAAQMLKIELHRLEIRSADDIGTTMTAGNLRGLDAVFVVGDPLTFRYRRRIHELAALQKVPTFVPAPEYVEGLALMAYGPSLLDASRQAAVYVDKILKGARAAELPIERPREYRLVVNLRAAKALGLTIPPSLMVRADEVIQ
jgi:putative ABC transport system substrate-binding protein